MLIVTYELSMPQLNQEHVVQALKQFGPWARLSDTSYLLDAAHEPVAVRNHLAPLLYPGDKLYVGRASAPSAWQGIPEGVAQFIRSRQGL